MADFTEQDAKDVIGRLKGKTLSCCLCATPIKPIDSHNAWPIMDDRCCATCNFVVVIPERMKQYAENTDARDDVELPGEVY